MPFKVWAVGEEVLAADFNDYVQEQVIATFPNSVARTAAIPAPTPGMASFLTDVARLEIFTAKTNPPSWQRPWHLAWGRVNYVVSGAWVGFGGGAQFIPGTAISLGNVPGRIVKVETFFNYQCNWAGDATCRFWLQTNTAIENDQFVTVGPQHWAPIRLSWDYLVTAPGQSVQAALDTPGGGNVDRIFITANDVGPGV